ncbi:MULTISPECIES: type III pantothenate kinase [Maribacter]|uniref:Type III pantothenate kinase n=1 Tax=Maribacter flavus TaxID=1658664 RepID=A0ABU7IFT7_9FLAO|nr:MULTISPECIES: type III pantothenate kinase [Maribacter]MDC6405383.1 type III pantothenate kinase [Maribacter sp. PR66]MEE1971809.1 type III pantothenate kinase [Maribacter flavus]
MNLVVDIGNTFVKFAVFDKNTLIFDERFKLEEFTDRVKELFKRFSGIERAIYASVGVTDNTYLTVLTLFCKVHVLSHESKVPFKNSYATPQTLGIDRIALVTAAFYHAPHKNTLVIDAGTCITYDMVNDFDEYLGGAISPGLEMRYKAMHQQTLALPLLPMEAPLDLIGNTTNSSMHSGVVNGICAELDGIIDQYATRFKDLTVILTGGDSHFLSKRLKNTIFADSKFLLKGLNYLLEYNKH